MLLPCHNRITSTPAEPMHLIKNVPEHLVRFFVVSKILTKFVKRRDYETTSGHPG